MTDSLKYRRGTRSVRDLNEDIQKVLQALRVDEELQTVARNAGIEPSAIEELDPRTAIVVRPSGAGIDPASVDLIVSFSPVYTTILISLWKKVVLPRIERRWGVDAIKARIEDGL